MDALKVSIIITNYNYGRYLERCIRSCVSQNFLPTQYEVVVVDDASTDHSRQILEKYDAAFDNFRYIVNETNVGVAEAANIGIRRCFGRNFVRVDADDYVSQNLILFLYEYLIANHDAFCVSCDYWLVDAFENKIERRYAETHPISCGILYRTDLVSSFGLYNKDFRHREEEELRQRLGDYYSVHHLRIPLYRYRIHGANKTTDRVSMDRFRTILDELRDGPAGDGNGNGDGDKD